jgi:aminotransferase
LLKEQVEALAKVVLDNHLYLILDEAYEYLVYDKPFYSPMLLQELRQRTILSKSFSKEYAMTGWRIGYLWAPEEIVKKIHEVHLYFTINPATISIVAATIVMEDPRGKKAMEDFRNEITKSRGVICERMDHLSSLFSYTKPMGSFYLFPKILLPDISAVDFAKKLVEETGVITIPGDSMGPSGKGHVRLSFSASPEVIHTAFARIDAFAKKNGFA